MKVTVTVPRGLYRPAVIDIDQKLIEWGGSALYGDAETLDSFFTRLRDFQKVMDEWNETRDDYANFDDWYAVRPCSEDF